MKKIRIGIVASQFGNLFRGGAEVQVEKTVKYLRKYEDIDIKYIDCFTKDITGFDLIHFFRSCEYYYILSNMLHEKEIPYVISTIYYPSYGSFIAMILYKLIPKLLPERVKSSIPFFQRYEFWKSSKCLFPNTDDEASFFRKFNFNRNIKIINNGIDLNDFIDIDTEIFYDKYPDLKDQKFVLNVGRIEKRKNQINLILACKKLNIPLVVIGQTREENYLKQCKEIGYDKFYYLGPIFNRQLLLSAYKACEVFCLPSTLETPGLSALEAAYFNKPIVITKVGGTKYYFKNCAYYVNPRKIDEIAEGIKFFYYHPEQRYNTHDLVMNYSWDKIVDEYRKIYLDICTDNAS